MSEILFSPLDGVESLFDRHGFLEETFIPGRKVASERDWFVVHFHSDDWCIRVTCPRIVADVIVD